MSLGHALLLLVPAAAAQDAPLAEPAADPPEIVVTGERRTRKRSETAASVVVFGGQDIERQPAADRLESILPLIPNVQMGTGGDAPAIRGQDTTGVLRDLPAFLGGTRPRTTLQIDGRPADYFELVFGLSSLWDVDRVEVFRSPQTITQGRNAIAGAIFVATADPTFDWRRKARAIVSTGGRRQLSAAVGGPLIGEDVAFRLSGDIGRDRPHSNIADRMVGAGPDIDKQWLVRGKLLAKPVAGLRIEAGYTHSRSQMPQLEGIRAPFRERRDPDATYGVFGSWIDALTGEVGYSIAPTFRSTTTLTASTSRFRRYAPPGLGQALARKRSFTGEEILRWHSGDDWTVLGGIHWLHESTEQRIDISQLVGTGTFDDSQRSVGVFGEVEWKAAPRLTVAAALRYQADRQDRRGKVVGTRPSTLDYRGRFDAWLPRLTLTVSASEALTFGALTQKAYNPGGSTLLLNGMTDAFDAETLWDHELFARGTLARGRVHWAANLFVQRFRNAQRPESFDIHPPVGPPITISELANAPRATSKGVELDGDWRLGSTVTLRAGLGYLDTRIDRTLSPDDPILGKQFQRAPHWSGSGAIEWRPVETLRLSAQARSRSGYFSDDVNRLDLRISGGTIIDAKADYDVGPATVSIYVRNLADRYQFTAFANPTLVTAEDPREFGLELASSF